MAHITLIIYFFFFFNDTATTEIYTLSLHDALPISGERLDADARRDEVVVGAQVAEVVLDEQLLEAHLAVQTGRALRSEEHTSELQSPCNLVCRLLLEKKKKTSRNHVLIDVHRDYIT